MCWVYFLLVMHVTSLRICLSESILVRESKGLFLGICDDMGDFFVLNMGFLTGGGRLVCSICIGQWVPYC